MARYICVCRVRRLGYEVYEYVLPAGPGYPPTCYDRKKELEEKFGPLAEVECELDWFEW